MYRLFEKAMLLELIPLERNPMCLVELKGVSKRKKSPRILTVEEFGALLKELVHPYRCMVLLAGCIGLRISEVLGLCWTGIKFETLCMEIREGFARSQVTKLKSEYSQDEMPLDPDVATILLEWKQLCPQTKEDWVFPSPRTEKPYDSGSLRKKILKTAALRAKILGAIGWHTLRHSYRAWLDETGAPLGVQQKLMRHANISTTMNIYGGAFMKAKRKANTSVVQRPAASRSHQIKKTVSWTALILTFRSLQDHFGPQSKIQIPRNSMIALVAGGGFEPPTFGL
jgi:integrase